MQQEHHGMAVAYKNETFLLLFPRFFRCVAFARAKGYQMTKLPCQHTIPDDTQPSSANHAVIIGK